MVNESAPRGLALFDEVNLCIEELLYMPFGFGITKLLALDRSGFEPFY